MNEDYMDLGSTIQHDLRREFHNMIGLLKIIKHENIIFDEELKHMIDLSLKREEEITLKLGCLTELLEVKNVK